MSETEHEHLAVLANKRSIENAMAGNREAWLALFRDDAVLRDPVGPSPFNPEGNGYRGKEEIAYFFDNFIAPVKLTITPGLRCPSGDRYCAVPMQAINDMGEGKRATIDMIAVYEVDDDGLIRSMSAYWDWSQMEGMDAYWSES